MFRGVKVGSGCQTLAANMKPNTEMAIRSITQTDDEIKSEHLEQAIDLMKGKKPDAAQLLRAAADR